MAVATSGKVPVSECASASWRFFADNWQKFLPAALVAAGFSTLGSLVGGPTLAGLILGSVIVAVADLAFSASVLRKAVRNEYAGVAGLQMGADEVRLVGVALCSFLILLPAVFVFGLMFSFAMAGRLVSAGVDPAATEIDPEVLNKVMIETLSTPAGAAAAVALVAIIIFVSARLVMTNAATIGERKIVFLQTWGWSKGNVLRVLGAMVLTALPVVLVSLILGILLAPLQSANAAGAVVISYVRTLVGMIASIPLIALGAHLYKGLRPPDFRAK